MKIAIFFFIIGMIGLLTLGVFHEQVHVEIYRHYGIESRIEYIKDFPDFTTYPEESCPTEECELANNINEVVGYHLLPLGAILVIALTIIIMFLEEIMIIKFHESLKIQGKNE